jgi:predicted TIM-barrel fold metal-dependent hydrolase
MNQSNNSEDWPIYNCHIHTFTRKHAPRWFPKWAASNGELGRIDWEMIPGYIALGLFYGIVLVWLARSSLSLPARPGLGALLGYPFLLFLQALLVIPILLLIAVIVVLVLLAAAQGIINLLLRVTRGRRSSQPGSTLMQVKQTVERGQSRVMRSNLLFDLLVWINPGSNDIFERTARFLKIAERPTQAEVFEQVALQYPKDNTVFIVLPMDMTFMNLGDLDASIEEQHDELLKMAQDSGERIIPFYAADPRHPDIVERVKKELVPGRFHGIKIYPNLGYRPDDPKLMEIYKLCIKGDFPVMTHCSPGGIWRYGVTRQTRRENSKPENYREILDMKGYGTLKLCLAHFGGIEEWKKHLRGRVGPGEGQERPWVKTVYDMIASGKYPNLYTDISYTLFTPKVEGLYIDVVDYLKVLLSNPLVRRRVLFGSDYYMVERENVS